METIKPVLDYCYGKKVERDTGVVTGSDIRDTHQLFEILAVGDGCYENGVFIAPSVKAGDIVYIQKHAAEGDTPKELEQKDYALFKASRVMAVIEKAEASDGN